MGGCQKGFCMVLRNGHPGASGEPVFGGTAQTKKALSRDRAFLPKSRVA